MFEKKLKEDLQKIFGVKKVDFDQPGDAREQECLFVEIDSSKNVIKDGRQLARVEGSAFIFGNSEKLPFGFYSRAIKQASINLTKNFFFYDMDANTKMFKNIVQRGFSFVYFYDAQYDPEHGSITSITLSVEE